VNTALAVLAALGGVVIFSGAIFAGVRAVVKQIHATELNTAALEELVATNTRLGGKLDTLAAIVSAQGERIARLEGGTR
jgi:hypothetical protein